MNAGIQHSVVSLLLQYTQG